MPELAEVEIVRKQIEKRMLGRKIKEIVVDENDKVLFKFASIKDVRKALTGAKVIGTGRKGKYFWLELDRKPWPVFHFGMSGYLTILDPSIKKLPKTTEQAVWDGAKTWRESDEELQDRLWFSKLLMRSDKGLEVAFIDPRRFGRIWLSDDPLENPRIKKLGYDPLIDFPGAKVLSEKLKKRKKAIKSVLLDQTLFAGIGNWLADEILYHAKISPHHLASTLTPAQLKGLHKSILDVVKTAVKVDADSNRFPKTWLFKHRWGKNKTAQTSRGHKIIHEDIGGRTTAWVPGWQK